MSELYARLYAQAVLTGDCECLDIGTLFNHWPRREPDLGVLINLTARLT